MEVDLNCSQGQPLVEVRSERMACHVDKCKTVSRHSCVQSQAVWSVGVQNRQLVSNNSLTNVPPDPSTPVHNRVNWFTQLVWLWRMCRSNRVCLVHCDINPSCLENVQSPTLQGVRMGRCALVGGYKEIVTLWPPRGPNTVQIRHDYWKGTTLGIQVKFLKLYKLHEVMTFDSSMAFGERWASKVNFFGCVYCNGFEFVNNTSSSTTCFKYCVSLDFRPSVMEVSSNAVSALHPLLWLVGTGWSRREPV